MNPEDDELLPLAQKENIPVFRGDEANVLSRFYGAAKSYQLDRIVRITADCPCIDPVIVDRIVSEHILYDADYTSNSVVRSWPHGLDTEVFEMKALEKAFQEAKEPYEKEHVTPYFYNNPSVFRVKNIQAPKNEFAPEIRITLDREEDYALLCIVYDSLYRANPVFGVGEILSLFREKPWLGLINQHVAQKKRFESLQEEKEAALQTLRLQELNNAARFLKDHWTI